MKKVITYGTFDMFHEGHRRLLERAKALGGYLIVGVTTEQFDIQRGKMNVEGSLMRRIDNVRSTGLADEVIIEEHEGQKIADIQKYEIDIFAIGSDWHGKFDYLKEYCEVVYLERTKDISSTVLREEQNGIVSLGFVGTGRIAGRTMDEVKHVSGVNSCAAYNPHIASAESFAEKHGLGLAFDDYGEFLKYVAAVYVASPHGTHYEYAKRALLAGKHVLCEKPMTLREHEARELFALAQQRGLVLMEALKTAYAPGFLNLLAIAKTGRLGQIRDVEATFTKLVPESPCAREYDPEVGGSFTELASYPLLPIFKLLGAEYRDLRFDYYTGANGVDIYTKAHFKYDGAVACAKTGIGVKSEGQLLVSGTKGYILVKSPWWLLKSFEVCYENPEDNEIFSAPFPGYGMRFEVADFVHNISEPATRNYKLRSTDSIELARVMEAFLRARDEKKVPSSV
jgi:glycerol-3-phosphate cytidylyltransferase